MEPSQITPSALNAITSKFDRDEIYSWLAGLGIALIYFLTLVSRFDSNKKQFFFFIQDRWYTSLFLLLSVLLGTLIVYTIYALGALWPASDAKRWMKKKYPKGPIANPDHWIKIDSFKAEYIKILHPLGLMNSVLFALIPYSWLFFQLQVKLPTHFYVLLCSCISIGILLLIVVFSYLVYFPYYRIYFYFLEAIEDRKIKITNDEKEFCIQSNKINDLLFRTSSSKK